MHIGLTVGHEGESLRRVAELARTAEQAGLDVIGFSDSQSVFRDTYCAMTAAALATERALLITTMTNVMTRHPVVTAGAIASVDEVSGGRALLGIGTGASSVANLGLNRATPKELRAGVETIHLAYAQALGTAPAGERTVLLQWPERAVPVIVGASTSAPMAMRVAAECGDGVMLIGEVAPNVLADRIRRMREQREASGRAGDVFSVWVYAPGWIEDGAGTGRATIAGTVAATSVTILDETRPEHGIPEELTSAFRRFREQHDFRSHGTPKGQDEVMRELGIADHLYGRIAVGGTAAQVVERLSELEEVGVEGIVFGGFVPDKLGLIHRLGDVATRLRKQRTA